MVTNREQVWLDKVATGASRLFVVGLLLLIMAVILTGFLWHFLGGIKNSLPKSTDYWKGITTTTELEAKMKQHLVSGTSVEISLLAMLLLAGTLAIAGPLITSSILCFKLRTDRKKFLSIIKHNPRALPSETLK